MSPRLPVLPRARTIESRRRVRRAKAPGRCRSRQTATARCACVWPSVAWSPDSRTAGRQSKSNIFVCLFTTIYSNVGSRRRWANGSGDRVPRPPAGQPGPRASFDHEQQNLQKCLITQSFRRECPNRQFGLLRRSYIFPPETAFLRQIAGDQIGVCFAQTLQPWASARTSGRTSRNAGPRHQRNLTAIGPARHATRSGDVLVIQLIAATMSAL